MFYYKKFSIKFFTLFIENCRKPGSGVWYIRTDECIDRARFPLKFHPPRYIFSHLFCAMVVAHVTYVSFFLPFQFKIIIFYEILSLLMSFHLLLRAKNNFSLEPNILLALFIILLFPKHARPKNSFSVIIHSDSFCAMNIFLIRFVQLSIISTDSGRSKIKINFKLSEIKYFRNTRAV